MMPSAQKTVQFLPPKTDDFNKEKLNYGVPLTSSPAAHDTLAAFFRDTGTLPKDYDLVITGDLGELGHAILRDLLEMDGIPTGDSLQDCGLLLYDRKGQDMHAGASGCGCSAAVLNAFLLPGLAQGKWQRILFAPTGALLSPTSSFQGESIPGICHAVCLTAARPRSGKE